MSKDRENENKNAQIPPALESWINNVIVPALVKRYLAELKEHDEPTSSSASNDRETKPVGVLKNPTAETVWRKQMLTVAEAASRLGLSQGTVRAWISSRRITYVRLGRAIRIPAEAVRDVIERGIIPAKPRQ